MIRFFSMYGGYLLRLSAVVIIYALLAAIAVAFFSANGTLSVLWPCSGFALGVLLLGGVKYWPGIFIGSLTVCLTGGFPIGDTVLVSAANALEPVMGWWLLNRSRRFEPDLIRPQSYWALAIIGLFSTGVNALLAALVFIVRGVLTYDKALGHIVNLWQAALMGVVLITPLMLVWRKPPDWHTNGRIREALLCFALAILFGQIIFLGWHNERTGLVFGFWMFMFVVWGAVRLGRHGSALVIFTTNIQGLLGQVYKKGFYSTVEPVVGLLNFWTYTLVLSTVGTVLALILYENTEARRILSISEEKLRTLTDRLNEEVANAAILQQNLLPSNEIALPGVTGLATMKTSSEVGGDFYDYFVIDGRYAVILVGDVSGHGIAAGTIVCAAKAAVAFLESEQQKEPGKILGRLSNVIFNTAHQSLLMTMFAACLDTQTGELRYANAGHQFPYLHRAMLGQLECLEIGGLPLGKSLDTAYEQWVTEIDVGDRLFLYTDSLVEEESPQGQCFGYDRFEALLAEYADSDMAVLHELVLAELTAFVQRTAFHDDLTLLTVEFLEKTYQKASALGNGGSHWYGESTHLKESDYRLNPLPVPAIINRQELVFLADGDGFADLLPELCQQGVRRFLQPEHPVIVELGLDILLDQHMARNSDDLATLLPYRQQHREFAITHSEDKEFIIMESMAWLQETGKIAQDRLDSVVLLLDELIENGLYAAPRDGRGRALYAKGTPREVAIYENMRLELSIQDHLLAIALKDAWGTLTPNIFLQCLIQNIHGDGITPGVGGGGLYLIWRMSDYLQVRVLPNIQTQVTLVLDMLDTFDPVTDKAFQFLYHTELLEVVTNESA